LTYEDFRVTVADLDYHVDSGIATITLNRPARKNAFTLKMIDAWVSVLRQAGSDPEVRVVVLTGAGDAFCSGVDLRRGVSGPPETPIARKLMLSERVHQIPLAMEDLDKPVIAAINGVAVGAGLDMALMCDIRIMARSARVSEGYIRVGMVPGDGGCYYLPRLVGVAKALELLWTGDFVSSEEAERIGLVNSVVEDSQLAEVTTALARKIADAHPMAIRMIKRATYQSLRSDLRTSLDLISSHTGVIGLMADSQEAREAFAEHRRPRFTGK
jgi:enoyl-CoA hydratase/carnithine racemase